MLNKDSDIGLPPYGQEEEMDAKQRRVSRGLGHSSTIVGVRRRLWLVWYVLADSLDPRDLKYRMYRWYGAFRSFLAHIRIQSSRTSVWVDLGPLGMLRDGRYQNHEHIRCRAEGIETLRASFPWVDSVDVRMFLLGVDAGEKYSMAARDRRAESIPEVQRAKG
jgi:hypothetical protein